MRMDILLSLTQSTWNTTVKFWIVQTSLYQPKYKIN